jgi:hypothetical protein
MVVMQRNQFGDTVYGVLEHTRTLVVVDPEGYYAKGQYPAQDEDGYYLPDDQIDCSEYRVANARLIAAAPELLEALIDAVSTMPADSPVKWVLWSRVAIAKATGVTYD